MYACLMMLCRFLKIYAFVSAVAPCSQHIFMNCRWSRPSNCQAYCAYLLVFTHPLLVHCSRIRYLISTAQLCVHVCSCLSWARLHQAAARACWSSNTIMLLYELPLIPFMCVFWQVTPGSVNSSYGIAVAKKAGLSPAVRVTAPCGD